MSQREISYEETTFLGLLKIAGIEEFLNYSMLYSLLISCCTWYFLLKDNVIQMRVVLKELSPLILSTAGTVFGIVIAALAVTISVFYKPVLPKMLEQKLLHVYMFPFWKASVLWGILLVVNLFIVMVLSLNLSPIPFFRSDIIVALNLFIFLYSVFYTIRLSGEVIRLTMQSFQRIE